MRRPLGDGWRHAPGPGDLPARTGDPRNEQPGGCPECDGPHPANTCPHLTATRRPTRKDAA